MTLNNIIKIWVSGFDLKMWLTLSVHYKPGQKQREAKEELLQQEDFPAHIPG